MGEKVTAPLLNPAGQERFGNMTRVYYKEAVGALVVFDVTRGSTFEAVSKWKHDLDSKVKLANGNPIPSVLLANKCDQKKESFNSKALMDNFCKEAGFLGWFETSAKVRDRGDADVFPQAVGQSAQDAITALMPLRVPQMVRAVFLNGLFTVDSCGEVEEEVLLMAVVTAVTHGVVKSACDEPCSLSGFRHCV